MLGRRNVVRNFPHFIEGDAGNLFDFEQEQVREGRLRPFDLRRKDCFLSNVAVEEERRVGQHAGEAVEPAQRQVRCVDLIAQVGFDSESVLRRKRVRHEGAPRLPAGGRTRDPGSAWSSLHAKKISLIKDIE